MTGYKNKIDGEFELMIEFKAKNLLLKLGIIPLSCLLVLAYNAANGQSLKHYYKQTNINRITISNSDSIETVSVLPLSESVKINASSKRYYWYANNKINSTEGAFAGRLLDGDYTLSNRNSALLSKGKYKNGFKDGAWRTWYPNGSLHTIENWKKSVRHKDFTEFYLNGNVQTKGQYKNNQLHGKIHKYSEDGKREVFVYRNGTLKNSRSKVKNKEAGSESKKKVLQQIKTKVKKVKLRKQKPA